MSFHREQKKFEVNEVTFEDMLDRLEKNSGHNVVSAKVVVSHIFQTDK